MVERESGASRLFNILNYVFLAFIGIICLYPFLYVVFASFSDPNQFIKHDFTVLWAPAGFSLEAYKHVFTGELGSGYMNTLIYVVAGTAISMLLTFLGAYVLSRKGYLLKKPLTMVIMFTMYFNGGMIPFYLWINQLGMVDTRWAILLPTALNTYNMIVMRTAFASVPESLIEAAKLDGASDFTCERRISPHRQGLCEALFQGNRSRGAAVLCCGPLERMAARDDVPAQPRAVSAAALPA